MLKSLYTEFDKSCVQLEVFKLYTIGDCYVVLGCQDKRSRNPKEEAVRVIFMGLSMISIIRDVRAKVSFEDLDMRIGVHTVPQFTY